MKINNISISKAFLECGDDFPVTRSLVVKHPSLSEILKLGNGIHCDDAYWAYVFSLLSDPYDNMIWLDDQGIDYEEVSAFDVFLMKWEHADDEYVKNIEQYKLLNIAPPSLIMKEALSFFLGPHNFAIGLSKSNNSKVLYDTEDHRIQIDKIIFDYISGFIRLINGLDKTDHINPADKNAKKILIEDMRDEQRRKMQKQRTDNEDNDYLGKMIAGVVHGGNGGITPFNFKQLKIYQLYSSLTTQQKQNHFNHVMTGVYQGTVKFESINKKELNWMD